MKFYEIRIGAPESDSVVVFNNRKYTSLSDAVNQLNSLLDTMASSKDLIDEDLYLWVIRTSDAKKSKKKQETEIIQVAVGNEETTGEFCYEGVSFLSRASEFESMILSGMKEAGTLGNYSVVVTNGSVSELCFFSDLDMILNSIPEVRKSDIRFLNQNLTIFRRDEKGMAEKIARLAYLKQNGKSTLYSKVYLDENEDDAKAVAAFIDSEIADLNSKQIQVEKTPASVVEETTETVEE